MLRQAQGSGSNNLVSDIRFKHLHFPLVHLCGRHRFNSTLWEYQCTGRRRAQWQFKLWCYLYFCTDSTVIFFKVKEVWLSTQLMAYLCRYVTKKLKEIKWLMHIFNNMQNSHFQLCHTEIHCTFFNSFLTDIRFIWFWIVMKIMLPNLITFKHFIFLAISFLHSYREQTV